MSFTIPPATKAAGQSGFIADINAAYSALTSLAAGNVLNTAYAGGADPTGSADSTAAIQAALTAGMAFVPPGTYKVTAPLTVPSNAVFWSPARGLGIPIGNYGTGSGLPVTGAILKPSSAFSGAAVLSMTDGGSQAGGQQIRGISIDGSSLPSGNTVHGIQATGAVAAVTLRDCLIYGGTAGGGNGLDAQQGTGAANPDFWDVAHCKFSGWKGIGAHLVGVADCFFTACESTGNTGNAWDITNGNNCRYMGCKAEGSAVGWNLNGNWGSTGFAELVGCTAASNSGADFSVSGSGTGTFYLNGCIAGSTTKWAYSGTNNVKSSAAWNTSVTVSPVGPTLS